MLPLGAAAHETAAAGPLRLTIGWAQEPAYTGVPNAVEVDVSDAGGAPVAEVGSALVADVSFGGERIALPLVPTDRPGHLSALIVPTRAGTYVFRVTGTVAGQAVDATSTCSERAFDCVVDVAEVQFPAQEPSAGQLAERMSRELRRASRARDEASDARRLALAAGVVAVGALVTAGVVAVRGRRVGSRA